GIAAGQAARLGHGCLGAVFDALTAVMLLQVLAVLACDGKAEIAEAALGVAVAVGTEDDRHGVPARLALGVCVLLERAVHDAIERLGELAEGALQRLGHGGRYGVADHGDGDLLVDQRAGVGLCHVDALADLAIQERFEQLNKHGSQSRRATDGVKAHGSSVRLQASAADGLASASTALGPDGSSIRNVQMISKKWLEQFSD